MLRKAVDSATAALSDSFSSRVVDQIVDNVCTGVQNIANSEHIHENLKKNLNSLSAMAADVKEEMTNLELSGRRKRKREVKEWLEEVESIEEEVDELEAESQGIMGRFLDGGKAAELDKKIEKLIQQRPNFGKLVLDVCGTSGDAFLTNELVGQAFNENLEKILRLLKTKNVWRIGIYGMGGVGKTALVKHIYNQLQQQCEGHVYWVTVSKEFTVTGLQDKIAKLLGVDLSDVDEEDKRAWRIHRTLSQKKNSVLILDDLWEGIDMEKVGCRASKEFCRLIITTRSLGVCGRIDCQRKIPVQKLDEGEAWKLFKETLGIDIELDGEVKRIAKSMVKYCGGLPLGIITVARSMKGKTANNHTWEDAYVELTEGLVGKVGMSGDVVFNVLKYSFNQLYTDKSNEFNTIQLCFLYCSLYPRDHEIRRGLLVRNFISDGLVSERKSRRLRFQQGLALLDELVNVCLLEKCVNSDGEECVKMHDLVRDMALKIGNGKYMVKAGDSSFEEILDEEEWTKDLEKVSLANCKICEIAEGVSPDCPRLSTLLLWGNHELNVISDTFFSKIQGLCTLDLCKTNVRMLPDAIGDLESLKALLLENCENLESLPNLGNLRALRELDLSRTAIKEVPQGLEELLKLEFLSLMDAGNLKILPSGLLQKLVYLQHVSTPFHLQAPFKEIRNLKLLEEFNGGVESVKDFNCFIRSWRKSCWGERFEHHTRYTIIIGGQHHEEVVSFECSSYKKRLGLFGCNLEEGERVIGQDTEYLKICECEGLSISLLNDFPGLKRLETERCEGIECILRSEDLMQIREIGTSTAPTRAVFSSLTVILIGKCNKMRKVGLPVSALPNLERIEIDSCGEIEEIFDEDASIFPTLLKLKCLRLGDLPRLNSVSKATMICNSIEEISIRRCPRLMNNLPLSFDDSTPPSNLRRIEVEREWWESLDWDINPNLPLLLQSFLYFW